MTWKPLGMIDEQPLTCEQCGKTHLQRLVVLEDEETGDRMRVGTTCAAKLIGDREQAADAIRRAKSIDQIVTRLRERGLAYTKEWMRLRGVGYVVRRVGNPKRTIYSIDGGGQRLIVTEKIVRRNAL